MNGKKARRLAKLPALTLTLCTGFAAAKDCPADIGPTTTGDPGVSVEVLRHLVKPLTACELDAESQAWQELLRDKVEQISAARIAALNSKEQARQVGANDVITQPGPDIESNAPAEESEFADKTTQLQRTSELVADRTALIDRIEVILLELTAKGGDVAQYDDYIKAVSGIEVDVTDASATLTAVTRWLQSPAGGLRWAMNIIIFVLLILTFYVLSILAGNAARKPSPNRHAFPCCCATSW